MLAIHEIGEAIIGDKTPFDGISKEEKMEMEQKAMITVIGNLTDKDKMIDMLYEFDAHESKESVFAYFCDKIEADIQSKVYQDNGLHHSLKNQENNCTFKSSKVQKMLDDGAQTAFDIWYGYDKIIYQDSKDFPEFSLILDLIKEINLSELYNYVNKIKVKKRTN